MKIHEATGMPAGKQKLQYEVSWVSVVLAPSVVREANKSLVESEEWGDTWVWSFESILEVMMLVGGAGTG